MAWYDTQEGFEGLNDEEGESSGGKSKPYRFWLPPNVSKQVVFLTDLPQRLSEHNFHIDNSYKHWETCPLDNCFACEKNNLTRDIKNTKLNKDTGKHEETDEPKYAYGLFGRYGIGAWPVYTLTTYINKRTNEEVIPGVEILVAKKEILKKLAYKHTSKGGLYLGKFDIHRSSAKASKVGDDFEFIERMDKSFITDHGIEEIDLLNYFEPDEERMKILVTKALKAANLGSLLGEKIEDEDKVNTPAWTAEDDDDIPF